MQSYNKQKKILDEADESRQQKHAALQAKLTKQNAAAGFTRKWIANRSKSRPQQEDAGQNSSPDHKSFAEALAKGFGEGEDDCIGHGN